MALYKTKSNKDLVAQGIDEEEDYHEGDLIVLYKPYRFHGDLVANNPSWTQVEIGTMGVIVGYDDGDNTWLVKWDKTSRSDEDSVWTDPTCIKRVVVTDEEIAEVYKSLGVVNPNK